MANIKISELTALTPPDAADLVPVTDSSASQTKRTTVGEIVGIVNGDVDVADDGTATISELPVNKLQDGAARQLLQTNAAGTDVEWTSNVDLPGTLDVTGATTLDAALNVTGLASLDGGIDVDGAFTVADTSGNIATTGTLGVDGQSTLASAAVSDLTSGRVVLAGTSGELEDSAGLTFNGTQLDVDGDLAVTGSLILEGSTADDYETTLTVVDPTADRTIALPNQSGTVLVSGNASIVDADIAANAEIAVSKLANGSANQVLVTDGTDVSWSDDLTIAGNLTVNGTTTTVNTQTLVVEDKNIELGVVASPTDVTADGGGITLKGDTDKTINWLNATDAWTFSEHVNLASGKELRIAGAKVLDATSLGSGVTGSSLTSVGTLGSLTVTNSATAGTFIPTNSTPPTNGVYLPSANNVGIATNGTGALFIDQNGNVGIGSNPDGLLSLQGVNSNTPRLRIQHPSNDADAAISAYFDGSGTYLITGSNHYISSAGANAKFNAATGSAAWYLDGSGNGIFYNSSGSGSIAERLRITSAGQFSHIGSGSSGSPAVSLNGSAPSSSLVVDSLGRVLLGTSSQAGGAVLQVNGDRIKIASAKTPTSATDTGTAGEVCWDADYIYICVAADTWKRAAIATW